MISFLFCTFLKSNIKNPMSFYLTYFRPFQGIYNSACNTPLYFWVTNTGSVTYSHREQGILLTFFCIINSGAYRSLSCNFHRSKTSMHINEHLGFMRSEEFSFSGKWNKHHFSLYIMRHFCEKEVSHFRLSLRKTDDG